MHNIARLSVGISVLLVTSLQPVKAADFTILPPDAVVDGKSIKDWTGAWWTWALQAPNDTNPLLDTTGASAHVDNNGPVFFVAGNDATRSFTVPAGKPILLPLINAFAAEPAPLDPGFSLAARENAANVLLGAWVDNFMNPVNSGSLHASIDGHSVINPSNYLEVTDFFDMGPVQAGSVLNLSFGVPVGIDIFPTKSAGYWLMITDLSPGAHELNFGGSFSAFDIPPNCCEHGTDGPFSTDTFDTIVVTPEPASWPMLAGLAGLLMLYLTKRKRSARAA
jgi:hypothetical protein